MSWGEGASAAANTGSTASNVGSAANAAGTAADVGSSYGVMASDATPAYSFNLGDAAGTANEANVTTAGTSPEPSWFEQAYDTYDKFNKGMEQTAPEAWRGRGMNPQTLGYAYGKLNQFASMGKGGQATQAPTTINNYQQPDNTYLRRRGY